MEDTRDRLLGEFHDEEARREYADEFLDAAVALQIKTLRQQRDWTQQDLASRAGMKQSRISVMEQVDYSSWSVKTLRRLAAAFDLALVVRFESFGNLLGDITSLGRATLERPSFADDPVFHPETAVTSTVVDMTKHDRFRANKLASTSAGNTGEGKAHG